MTDEVAGIDVSHHNGGIDWAAVAGAAGRPQFVYLKATEGDAMVDGRYAVNRGAAKAQGLLCGAYHFFRPDLPVAGQVAHFCATVGSVAGELPPMLDIEQAGPPRWSNADYAGAVAQWLQQAADRLQCTPGIYTSASFWNSQLGPFQPFLPYPLWIANYTGAASPRLPPGASYAFWQYSDEGAVGGIAGKVDMSRFAGTPEQLRLLLCGA